MRTYLLLTALVSSLTLSACNTISGIGKDVQSMGSNLDSASKATSKAIDKETQN